MIQDNSWEEKLNAAADDDNMDGDTFQTYAKEWIKEEIKGIFLIIQYFGNMTPK